MMGTPQNAHIAAAMGPRPHLGQVPASSGGSLLVSATTAFTALSQVGELISVNSCPASAAPPSIRTAVIAGRTTRL